MFRANRLGTLRRFVLHTQQRPFTCSPCIINLNIRKVIPNFITGSLSICLATIKNKRRLLFPLIAYSETHRIPNLNVSGTNAPHLEKFEPQVEELLFTSRKSFWMRIRMIVRVVHLLLIFLPVALSSPLLLFINAQSRYIQWWWSLLRSSLEHAGACWIKFGQWASTRPDLFPAEMCLQLSELHSSCPSHPGEFSIKTITRELGCNLSDLFFYFDPEPMASGSIAQVHKGVLFNGRVVAVKVLHPHVYKNIAIDFSILYNIVSMIGRTPTLKWLSLPEGVLEFGKSMMRQLDLRREANNLLRFRENFRNSDSIVFPAPLYARKSVLIETFEPGEPILEYSQQKKNWGNAKIASLGFNAYLKMMLIDNFTHSDLHPGNILVRMVNNQPQLVLLDVGLVTELGPRDWSNFMELFESVVQGDGRKGAELMVKYASESQCQGECLEHFKDAMGKIFSDVQGLPLSSIRVGALMNNVLTTVRQHYVKIESNFATLVMGTIVLEGLGKQLDPNLNLIKEAIPYVLKEKGKSVLK